MSVENTLLKKTSLKPAGSLKVLPHEEKGHFSDTTFLEGLWVDKDLIPLTPPSLGSLDKSGIFWASTGTTDVSVLQKMDSVLLKRVGDDVWYSTYLIDCVPIDFGEGGYEIRLVDSQAKAIPFGLNGWSIDIRSGFLSFEKGLPQGFDAILSISFWRYVGRKGDSALLLNDGSSEMLEGYVPSKKKHVATKDYVDTLLGEITDVLAVIKPPAPPTFENKSFTVESSAGVNALVLTDTPYSYLTSEKPIVLSLPRFYNPQEGVLTLSANDYTIGSLNLSEVVDAKTVGPFEITRFGDSYPGDYGAMGFYKSLDILFHITSDLVKDYVLALNPLIVIKLTWKKGSTSYSSQPITVGYEDVSRPHKVSTPIIVGVSGEIAGYVSGVPAVRKSAVLTVGASISTLNAFKGSTVGESHFPAFSEKESFSAKATYDTVNPIDAVASGLPCEGVYVEDVEGSISAHLLDKSITSTRSVKWPIRVDGVSDETIRVQSGSGLTPTSYGEAYVSSEDLHSNEELQLIGGRFRWPSGDFSNNGNLLESSFSLPAIIGGPNYNDILTGTRYVTFKKTISLCNGVWLTFIDPLNIFSNDISWTLRTCSLQVCIKGVTGWLDASKVFDGVSLPRKDGDACLSASLSSAFRKRVTFGNAPLKGELFVRFGCSRGNESFSSISIEEA